MELLKVIGFALTSVILIVILKEQKKEMALILMIVASLGIMLFAISEISKIMDLLNELAEKSGIQKDYLILILKITGIAYLVEFGKNICIDSGQSSIASKLEMAGKVVIVSLSIPIITSLITVLSGLVL